MHDAEALTREIMACISKVSKQGGGAKHPGRRQEFNRALELVEAFNERYDPGLHPSPLPNDADFDGFIDLPALSQVLSKLDNVRASIGERGGGRSGRG